MTENFKQLDTISKTRREEKPDRGALGDYDAFMKRLKENMESTTEREMGETLTDLERFSQAPDRNIEVYTDPTLDTFCCGQVPSKKVTPEGEIVDDPHKKTYLIGVPFHFIAGRAPRKFLLGEIAHEQGHALWTDFGRMTRFRSLANQEGYAPEEILALDNCIEDPRMERLVGGPIHENERKLLFEKNRQMIIPNIAGGIGKMSPTDQFKFLVKLERLWAIHKKDLGDTPKPWNEYELNPKVKEEFKKIAPYLAEITGDDVRPAKKVGAEVERLIVSHIWPAHKRLIDEFPDKKQEGEGGKGGGGKGGGGKGKKGEPTPGEAPPESQTLDPNDPSTWPEPLQKFLQKMIEKHKQRLQKKAEQEKKKSEENKTLQSEREKQKHLIEKSRDGFDDPKMRQKYNEMKAEVAPVIQRLDRIFGSFLPRTDEPAYEWGRKGTRFSVPRYVRKIGTGYENPLGKKERPESVAFVLQILVDVSGSMSGERIENAVKACIATCEAAKNYNISIEILANDEGNITTSPAYLIKSFSDGYGGQIKSNVVAMMDKFGGGNEDADAIKAAIPRLRSKMQRAKAEVDRAGSLMIYISDSTTESVETKQMAEEARKYTPFEGTAITNEGDIPAKVKYHFGEDSIIPKTLDEFPVAFGRILQRHIMRLKPKE